MTPLDPRKTGRRALSAAALVGLTFPVSVGVAHAQETDESSEGSVEQTLESAEEVTGTPESAEDSESNDSDSDGDESQEQEQETEPEPESEPSPEQEEEEPEPEPQDETVTAEPPYLADENLVGIPEITGVTYTVAGQPVSGTVEVPEGGLTIVAVANEGYEISGQTEFYIEHTAPEPEPEPEVYPEAPSHDPESNTVTIPEVEGVVYSHTGVVEIPEGGLSITASAAEGYQLGEGAQTEFFFEHTAEEPEPEPEVYPESPAHDGASNTVTIPEVEGVVYSHIGTVEVPEDGLTITASAADGYELGEGAETEWFFEYVPDEPDDEVVVPEPPVHNPEENTVTVPEQEGVEYSHTGTVEVPEDGLTITATATDGYEFEEGAETEWFFEYVDDEPDDEVIVPEEPAHNPEENTVTVPEQEGVEYSHTGTVEVPEEGLTITATATEGYEFEEGAEAEWHYDHVPEDEEPSDPNFEVIGTIIRGSDMDPDVTYTVSVSNDFWQIGSTEINASEDGTAAYDLEQIALFIRPGTYTVEVEGSDGSSWSGEVTFDSDQEGDPEVSAEGETVFISGGQPDSEYTIAENGNETTVTTDSDGNASLNVREALELEPGDYTLYVYGPGQDDEEWSDSVSMSIEDEDPQLDELSLTADAESVEDGQSVTFSVEGTDEDGEPFEIDPDQVELSGLNPEDEVDGLTVTFHGDGERTITATYDGVESNPVTISVEEAEEYDPSFSDDGTVISGSGMIPGESYEVQVTWGWLPVGSTEIVADEDGNGSVDLAEDINLSPGQTYTVTITGPEDFESTLEVTTDEEAEVITPEEPSHNPDENTVTVPEQEGVEYSHTGTVDVPEGGLTITATAAEGYEFAEGSQTQWSYDYVPDDDEPDVEVITPQTPSHNADANTVSVPQQEGVIWSHGPGTVDVPEGGLTITATAAEGYEFADGADTQWSYDFVPDDDEPGEPEPELVTAQSPTRSDNSVSIPSQTGVTFTVNGSPVSGTISVPESGVTVIAVAQDGYQLDGQVVWHFEYFTDPDDPGDDPGDGEDPGDDPGDGEDPGDDPGDGEGPGEDPGDGEGPGDDPGEEPGDGEGEGPGDQPGDGEGPGDEPGVEPEDPDSDDGDTQASGPDDDEPSASEPDDDEDEVDQSELTTASGDDSDPFAEEDGDEDDGLTASDGDDFDAFAPSEEDEDSGLTSSGGDDFDAFAPSEDDEDSDELDVSSSDDGSTSSDDDESIATPSPDEDEQSPEAVEGSGESTSSTGALAPIALFLGLGVLGALVWLVLRSRKSDGTA